MAFNLHLSSRLLTTLQHKEKRCMAVTLSVAKMEKMSLIGFTLLLNKNIMKQIHLLFFQSRSIPICLT